MTRAELVAAMARAIQKRAEMLDPDVTWNEWVPEATAALAAIESAGGVVVPREATPAMVDAHFQAHNDAETFFADVPDVWRAMLAASPLAKEPSP